MPQALYATFPDILQERLKSARELTDPDSANPVSSLSTTVSGLDDLLAGGLPRGQMIEIIGHRSSGRFSTVLGTLAAATSMGEATALIDLGDSLDPQFASTAGVALERLLWIRPTHIKQALTSAEMLLVGGFSLVVLDLGSPPVPGGRGSEASWLRLARAAKSHAAVLLVSSPYRVSGTAAAGVVQADRGRALWTNTVHPPRLLLGISSRFILRKHRGYQTNDRAAAFHLVLPETATYHQPQNQRR